MANVYLDRIRKRTGYHNEVLEDFMDKLIAEQNESIAKKIAKLSRDHYAEQLEKLPSRATKWALPNVDDVLPKKSVFIKKAAEQGKLIRDTLRSRLSSDLQAALAEHTAGGGQKMVYTKGKKKGRINQALVNKFEKAITGTFEGYVKRNPELGYPTNVHNIAVTETRSTINQIKSEYVDKLMKKNSGISVTKIWRHNSIAAVPRHGHQEVNGTVKDWGRMFSVPVYHKKGGRWVKIRTDRMDRPHDPDARPDQIIGCNCDIEYRIKVKRGVRKELMMEALIEGIAINSFGASPEMAERVAKAIVEKGKAMPIGMVTHRKEGDFKKVGPDDWREVIQPKPAETKELSKQDHTGLSQKATQIIGSFAKHPEEAVHLISTWEGYYAINDFLHGKKIDEHKIFSKTGADIDRVAATATFLQSKARATLCVHNCLYHGTSLKSEEMAKFALGKTVTMDNLTCAAGGEDGENEAQRFAENHLSNSGGTYTIFKIIPAEGNKLLAFNGNSFQDGPGKEHTWQECLIAKDSKYKVVRIIDYDLAGHQKLITLQQEPTIQKSLDNIIRLALDFHGRTSKTEVQKGAPLPIGHISTYRDGTREQKIGPGQWKKLSDAKPDMGKPISEPPAGSPQREDPMEASMKMDPKKLTKTFMKDAELAEIHYDGYDAMNEYLDSGEISSETVKRFAKNHPSVYMADSEEEVKAKLIDSAKALQLLSMVDQCHYKYLYRGTGMTPEELSAYKSGQTVRMKKLSASSFDLMTAWTFSMGNSKYAMKLANDNEAISKYNEKNKNREPVIIQIEGDEHGLHAHDTNRSEYFDESLLAKGSEYEVIDVKENSRVTNKNHPNEAPLSGEGITTIYLKQKNSVQKAEQKIVELDLEWMPPKRKRLTDTEE